MDGGVEVDLASVKLLVPVWPRTLRRRFQLRRPCHRQARIANTKPDIPEKPDIGYRANNALIASDDYIVKPTDAGELFQYGVSWSRPRPHRSPAARPRPRLRLRLYHRQRCRRADLANSDRTLWRAGNTNTFARWDRGSKLTWIWPL